MCSGIGRTIRTQQLIIPRIAGDSGNSLTQHRLKGNMFSHNHAGFFAPIPRGRGLRHGDSVEQINTANSQVQGDSENPGTVRPLGTTFPTGNEREFCVESGIERCLSDLLNNHCTLAIYTLMQQAEFQDRQAVRTQQTTIPRTAGDSGEFLDSRS